MASLALLVGLIFLSVLLIGPISIFTCRFKFVPNFIAYVLAIVNIVLGMWWFLLPITAIRYVGIIPVFCGYMIINQRKTKKDTTQKV
jgi:hypothetical protein